MIKCICINDKHKPKEIPQSYWVEEGKQYHVVAIYHMVQPGAILGVILQEITLDENCAPYECFSIRRFGFYEEDLQALAELIKASEGFQEFDPMKLIEEEVGELLEV